MPENLMNSAHKSNSDLYRKEWERIFRAETRMNIGDFFLYPPRKVIFNDKDYAVIAVSTHKDKTDA